MESFPPACGSPLSPGGHCTVQSRTVLIKVKTRPSAPAQRCLALRLTCAASVRSAPWVDFFSPSAYVQVRPRPDVDLTTAEDEQGNQCLWGRTDGQILGDTTPIFKTRNLDDSFFYLIDAFLSLFIPEENKEIIVKIKNPKP